MALATSTRAYGTPPAGFIEIAALKNKAGDHPPPMIPRPLYPQTIMATTSLLFIETFFQFS